MKRTICWCVVMPQLHAPTSPVAMAITKSDAWRVVECTKSQGNTFCSGLLDASWGLWPNIEALRVT